MLKSRIGSWLEFEARGITRHLPPQILSEVETSKVCHNTAIHKIKARLFLYCTHSNVSQGASCERARSSYTQKKCQVAVPCYKELFISSASCLDCEQIENLPNFLICCNNTMSKIKKNSSSTSQCWSICKIIHVTKLSSLPWMFLSWDMYNLCFICILIFFGGKQEEKKPIWKKTFHNQFTVLPRTTLS